MLSELGRRPMIGSFDDELEKEIGALLRDQGRQEADERERELNLYRSGSAPPTVEGSLSAVNGFSEFAGKNGNGVMSEEDLRSDPAYLSYYYSNANLNPRLPPPLLSKEDWRSAQRLQGGSSVLGGIGDRRKLGRNESNGPSRPLGSLPPGFPARKEGREAEVEKMAASAEWGRDGLIGLSGIGLGSRQKSIAEILQDDLSHSSPNSRQPSRPASRNAFDENLEALSGTEAELANLCHESSNAQGSSVSYSYAAALGAPLSRSTTPDPQHVPRVPSPCPAPIGGGRTVASQNSFNESVNLAAALSNMNLSSNGRVDGEIHLPSQNAKAEHAKASIASFAKGSRPANLNGNLSPHYGSMDGMNSAYANQGMGGFSLNSPLSPMMAGQLGNLNLPPLLENVMGVGMGMDSVGMGGGSPYGHNLNYPMESDNLGRAGNLPGNAGGFVDPVYLQHLRTMEYAAQLAGLGNHSPDRSHTSNAYLDSLQKAYQLRLGNKSGVGNRGYFGNHSYGVGMGYHGGPMATPVIPNSPVGPGSPLRHNEFNMRYPNAARNMGGGAMGPWNMDGGFGSSLLEEFKSNKTKCFELVDIVGHVVEFSADQYGSRFIQQKLETASIEEKNMVFLEIISKALSLMTDVFGNYVVQKFFEHGMPNQRRELANKLDGHVLTLSLQMYGCRVIQKAIEVVDMDQKIRMVKELDGHIMRCVRDQNGNHVIQKCIECVPEEAIQFIIESFFDQVVNLSTHPYGCRVIQRVLEHCKDEDTQNKVMEEILGSVTMLAQDQYGNYVVQHVLEHGKPHERSFIIKELAGKIVQMSQQKFASNVIEKCLAFGDLEERELMVNEMLGTTDENEPLQAMMKDQFANYVVQKVLETCNDQQLELIMSRIKVHLNALKKYTYGKHIVARVEKLLAAGERRAGMSQNPAA